MPALFGYVAVTHDRWFKHLAVRRTWEEVNFWRPSAHHSFNGPPGSPFFFKLKAPHNAIGGFGLVARFARLPDWLAWECFGEANGAGSFDEMERRLNEIRIRNRFIATGGPPQIGCILLSAAVFFPQDYWIPQPADWSPRNLTYQRYDLTHGEGARIWSDCQDRLAALRAETTAYPISSVFEEAARQERYGSIQLVRPRLGQGTFRVAVTDAYARACTATGEHSLPALEAAHIQPFAMNGPHEVVNGLLLRSDLHRLFDRGYLTVTPEHRIEVSRRLREDYQNGRSYYPLHGSAIALPQNSAERPDLSLLRWHNENRFLG